MTAYIATGKPLDGTRGVALEVSGEFTLIETAIASKSDKAGETYTGAHDFTGATVTIPTKVTKAGDTYTGAHDLTGAVATVATQTPGDSSTKVASTAFVTAGDLLKADLASPTLTGVPAAPTAAPGTNTTQIASTAFVAATAMNTVLPGQSGNSGKFVTTDGTTATWESAAILGANTFTAAQELSTGTAIASATTINLDTATGNRVHITGTAAITTVTLTRGPRTVIFDGILTLTHHATTNNLPGAANITTAAGDRAIYESDGTTVYCVSYVKVSGAAVVAASTAEVITPTNTSPANAATDQQETPTLTGSTFFSLYGATHSNTQVQVHTTSDFTSPQYSSGDQAGSTSFTLPAGELVVSTAYYWRMRYKNSRGEYSGWSAAFSLTTAAVFEAFITTPTATPAAMGDAFEGGFYTGMIWNELIQSSTSTAIGTGSKVFAVSSAAAYAYSGQALEVRSRANPANKMIGTVTTSGLSSLTLNITSVGGSGTFTDWSIMSKYRLIVAPKASGESAALAYKNANTAAPAATDTLTEGLKATLAMVAAGSSTIYPAAHFCNNLNIGSQTDWYLPARDELELAWRNLKPSADDNYTAARSKSATNYGLLGSIDDAASTTMGVNSNSSPAGAAYTAGVPAQVAAGKNFRTGETEAFIYSTPPYWSSTSNSAANAWAQYFRSSGAGGQFSFGKADATPVRGFRRSII